MTDIDNRTLMTVYIRSLTPGQVFNNAGSDSLIPRIGTPGNAPADRFKRKTSRHSKRQAGGLCLIEPGSGHSSKTIFIESMRPPASIRQVYTPDARPAALKRT
jgi:hypothetical protein